MEEWQEADRGYLFAAADGVRLFARHSADPADRAVFAHEAAVREVVGREGPLRAPAVLERGEDWLLEEAIPATQCEGAACVAAVAAAAERIMRLELPHGPPGASRGRIEAWRSRVRLVASKLPIRDVVRARRIASGSPLPERPSHGDFHAGNILYSDGAAWVVDWELSALRPAGYDLMRCCATMRAPEREALFEAAVDLVGTRHRPDLLRLRYAVAVQTIAQQLAAVHDFNLDRAAADDLLRELPRLREDARL